ncbi:hypothetical protein [Paenibacillus sp. P22]|uniref:hypothetical protein n=1 Tax=Paenibacillus sp. P22 TaxID=483908 RepID=UPI00039005BC|nr:hypothetical protein [Paenibacillus sp. P22]CDN41453.1 hypothetical protein BN871_AH_00270 [Paenibacillus sp. P22]
MTIKSEWHIRHDGKEYPAGEVVSLPADAEKRLVDGGTAEYVEEPAAEGGKHIFPPPEEFAKLSAGEQKDHLVLAGIDPAGKAPERLEQYTTFFEEQVTALGRTDV